MLRFRLRMSSATFSSKAVFGGDGAVKIAVVAKPNAKETAITEIRDAVGIRVAARPKDGEANAEICRHFSKLLKISKRDVFIDAGTTGKNKVVVCKGVTMEHVIGTLHHASK